MGHRDTWNDMSLGERTDYANARVDLAAPYVCDGCLVPVKAVADAILWHSPQPDTIQASAEKFAHAGGSRSAPWGHNVRV